MNQLPVWFRQFTHSGAVILAFLLSALKERCKMFGSDTKLSGIGADVGTDSSTRTRLGWVIIWVGTLHVPYVLDTQKSAQVRCPVHRTIHFSIHKNKRQQIAFNTLVQ